MEEDTRPCAILHFHGAFMAIHVGGDGGSMLTPNMEERPREPPILAYRGSDRLDSAGFGVPNLPTGCDTRSRNALCAWRYVKRAARYKAPDLGAWPRRSARSMKDSAARWGGGDQKKPKIHFWFSTRILGEKPNVKLGKKTHPQRSCLRASVGVGRRP